MQSSKLQFKIQNYPKKAQDDKGQSIIEVIVAVAIMVIITGSSVIAILGSFSTTRLAKEETQATLFAAEGIEAVQSIRNQGWDDRLLVTDCSSGCGLDSSSGFWSFFSTSDTLTIVADRAFTRQIVISEVQRDGDGNIVVSGGTIDPDTKKATAAVTWNFSPTRSNTVDMVAYLTNWQTGRSEGTVGTVDSCAEYCLSLGYTIGTCRQTIQLCSLNGETYESGGDQYCVAPGANTCCCQ